MKLKEKDFTKETDYMVFKYLKGLLKDLNIIFNINIRGFRNNKFIIDTCYNSRRSHIGEDIFVNYTYWPYDIGIESMISTTYYPVVELIWASKVICSFGKDIKGKMRAKLEGLINRLIVIKALDKKSLYFFAVNECYLREALNNIGVNKADIDNIIDVIKCDKSNLPY